MPVCRRKGRLDLAVTDLGPKELKNIAEPIRVYSLDVGQPGEAKLALTAAPEKSAPPRLSMVRDPEHRSYRSFASFSDPDGNDWLIQEVTARLPGRVDADTTFTSNELAAALRRAAAAHGEHEKRTGQQDANWPDWYAEYIVREQAGKPLPS